MKIELIKEVTPNGTWFFILVDGWAKAAKENLIDAEILFDFYAKQVNINPIGIKNREIIKSVEL